MHPHNETSSTLPTTTDVQVPTNTSEYGFQPDRPSSAELRDDHDDEQSWSSDADATGELPSLENSPLPELGRLNLRDNNEQRPKPSFQRISEHENALAPSPRRKSSDGITFKVIKKKGNRLDGPQLDAFPNGKLMLPFVCEQFSDLTQRS